MSTNCQIGGNRRIVGTIRCLHACDRSSSKEHRSEVTGDSCPYCSGFQASQSDTLEKQATSGDQANESDSTQAGMDVYG